MRLVQIGQAGMSNGWLKIQIIKGIDRISTAVRGGLGAYILAVDEAISHRALRNKGRSASIQFILTLYLIIPILNTNLVLQAIKS